MQIKALPTVRLGRQRQVSGSRLQPADRQVGLHPSAFIQHAGVDGGAWNTENGALKYSRGLIQGTCWFVLCPRSSSPASLDHIRVLSQ